MTTPTQTKQPVNDSTSRKYVGGVEIVPTRMSDAQRNSVKQKMIAQLERQAKAKQAFLNALPTVVELAKTDCSGGYAAATLLLNLYNRHAFQFDLISLRNLDPTNWQACMDVLGYQAYASPDKEIHHYIEDGQKLMSDLWERYEQSKNCIDKR